MSSTERGFGSPSFTAAAIEACLLAVPSLALTVILGLVMIAVSRGGGDADGNMVLGIVLAVPAFLIGSAWATFAAARIRWRSGSYRISAVIIVVWMLAHATLMSVLNVVALSPQPGYVVSAFVETVFGLLCYFAVQILIGYAIGSAVAARRPAPLGRGGR